MKLGIDIITWQSNYINTLWTYHSTFNAQGINLFSCYSFHLALLAKSKDEYKKQANCKRRCQWILTGKACSLNKGQTYSPVFQFAQSTRNAGCLSFMYWQQRDEKILWEQPGEMFQTSWTFVTAAIICLIIFWIITDLHSAISFHLIYNLNLKISTILGKVLLNKIFNLFKSSTLLILSLRALKSMDF